MQRYYIYRDMFDDVFELSDIFSRSRRPVDVIVIRHFGFSVTSSVLINWLLTENCSGEKFVIVL